MVKPALAVACLALFVAPLVHHMTFERRVEDAEQPAELVLAVVGIGGGFTFGVVAIVLLAVLCDGGPNFRPVWLMLWMAAAGIAWCFFYPGGWVLGIPTVVYSGEKLCRAAMAR